MLALDRRHGQWADDLRLSDIEDRFKARPGLRANPYAAGKAEMLPLLRDHPSCSAG